MTFAEEFVAGNEGEAPQATFLGLAISPVIIGVILAVLGAGGAGYMGFTMVKPVWDENTALNTEITDLTGQVESQKASLSKIDQAQEKVDSAKLRREEMLAFFAKDEALDTILLDFEAIVKQQKGLKLDALSLAGDPIVINDGSLGESANGRFKQQPMTLNITGTFSEIRALLQSLEKFEPIVQVPTMNLTSSPPTQKIQVAQNGKIQVSQENVELTTTLNLQIIVARSQAEIDKDAAEAAAAAAEAEAAAAAQETPPP
ncbi:MAG: type 4a pilus biogenesis protein PilO [Prochlorotrichaceae cyanobacterium]